MSTIILTTGQPGSGKSYSRVRWLLKEFLLNQNGIYITNIPVNIEEICKEMSLRTSLPAEDFERRIVVIPHEILKSWEMLQSADKKTLESMKNDNNFPPASFFDQYDLNNAHIAIDEFHLYFCKQHPIYLKQLWQNWFAEIRKLGCTFEAITQDSALLPREFIGKVGIMIDLVPLKNTRDPFFKILMGDWYELRAGFLGLTEQKVQQEEKIKVSSLTGVKWKVNHIDRFVISSEYYRFYNSYQRNDTQQVGKVQTPAEKYGKNIIFWFIKRNFFPLLSRFFIVVLFFWLCFGGGIVKLISYFTVTLKTMSKSQTLKTPNVNEKSKNVVYKKNLSQAHNNNDITLYPKDNKNLQQKKDEVIKVDEIPIFNIVMFYKDKVYFSNGEEVYVNYKFNGGIYDKKIIKDIDFKRRFIVLDDNTIIRM